MVEPAWVCGRADHLLCTTLYGTHAHRARHSLVTHETTPTVGANPASSNGTETIRHVQILSNQYCSCLDVDAWCCLRSSAKRVRRPTIVQCSADHRTHSSAERTCRGCCRPETCSRSPRRSARGGEPLGVFEHPRRRCRGRSRRRRSDVARLVEGRARALRHGSDVQKAHLHERQTANRWGRERLLLQQHSCRGAQRAG